MKSLFISGILLVCNPAAAATYVCPQTYPGKDAPAAALTGGSMRWGELNGDGWITGTDEAAEEGYNVHYAFDDNEQAWLVCGYGATQRIPGRVHDGHEWNQTMAAERWQWWIKLAPKAAACTLQVREMKSRKSKTSTWMVTAHCTG